MELLHVLLPGRPARFLVEPGDGSATTAGLVGVDIGAIDVEDISHTVVQLLLDDDAADFDPTLLDAPVIAELSTRDGDVVQLEPFDHDSFRRILESERDAGRSTTRGVLLRTDGQLPPPWIRLAFLPAPITSTGGMTLTVRRTTVDALVAAAEETWAAGGMTDDERRAVLSGIEQRHPRA